MARHKFPKGNKAHLSRKSHGPFVKGNELWRLVVKPTSSVKFTPEELIDGFSQYVEWAIENPLHANEIVRYKDSHEIVGVPRPRPLTVEGFCNHIGMAYTTFAGYKKRVTHAHAANMIQQYIDNQQYEGAAAGLFQHQIVARKLGLADKKEVSASVTDMKESEILKELRELQGELVDVLSDEALRGTIKEKYGSDLIDDEEQEAIDELLGPTPKSNLFPSHSDTPTTPKPIYVRPTGKPQIEVASRAAQDESKPEVKVRTLNPNTLS